MVYSIPSQRSRKQGTVPRNYKGRSVFINKNLLSVVDTRFDPIPFLLLMDTDKLVAYRAASTSFLSTRQHLVIPMLGIMESWQLLILSESLVGGGFEPLTIGSMHKDLTVELS